MTALVAAISLMLVVLWGVGMQFFVLSNYVMYRMMQKCYACSQQDDGTFTIFDAQGSEAWTTSEEEMLLDAVEQFGFGNW